MADFRRVFELTASMTPHYVWNRSTLHLKRSTTQKHSFKITYVTTCYICPCFMLWNIHKTFCRRIRCQKEIHSTCISVATRQFKSLSKIYTKNGWDHLWSSFKSCDEICYLFIYFFLIWSNVSLMIFASGSSSSFLETETRRRKMVSNTPKF